MNMFSFKTLGMHTLELTGSRSSSLQLFAKKSVMKKWLIRSSQEANMLVCIVVSKSLFLLVQTETQPRSFQTKTRPAASPKVSILGPQKLWSSEDTRCKQYLTHQIRLHFAKLILHFKIIPLTATRLCRCSLEILKPTTLTLGSDKQN